MIRAAKFLAAFFGMMAMLLFAACLGGGALVLLGKWAWLAGVTLFVVVSAYFSWIFSSRQ